VAIGVSSVMVLTSLGEGARGYITGEFASLGSNLLIIVPGKTETQGEAPIFSQAPHDLTLQDAEAILRRSPRIRRVAPILLGTAMGSHGERRREIRVIGTTSEMLPIRRMQMAIGRFLPEGDLDRSARVCVIGSTVHRELFGGDNPLGSVLHVGGERFKVIGVMSPRGTSLGFNMDEIVEVPVSAAMALFDKTSLFRIMAEVRNHDEMEAAAKEVISVLKERHDGVEDVTVIRQDSLLAAFDKILSVLTSALAAIAAVSLGVAGIGIMNVMLVSVTERTAEIGLLKAVGADSRQILEAFLVEASLLSTIGGALGVAGGYALAGLTRHLWPALPAHPPAWSVVSALVVALGVGLAFGAMPARRAARLEPVSALARRGH
jgi:putative ABC transport system permease protein